MKLKEIKNIGFYYNKNTNSYRSLEHRLDVKSIDNRLFLRDAYLYKTIYKSIKGETVEDFISVVVSEMRKRKIEELLK